MKATAKKARRERGRKQSARQEQESLSFTERLAVAAGEPGKRKGERTRARLKSAAAALLEERGYRNLRVTDINEKANVSNALFYLYFPNKDVITEEVMREFLDVLFSRTTREKLTENVEEAIYWANFDYVSRFTANPGLMRCLLQFGDEIADFEKLFRERNGRWVERAVKRFAAESDLAWKGVAEVWTATAALGVMMDGILRLIYVERDPRAREHARSVVPGNTQLALFLTRIWVRTLFSREMTWSPRDGT